MKKRGRGQWATPSKYPRTARINEVLREVIASSLERLAEDDPRLQLVTVTGVDADADTRRAAVYFSALGTQATDEEVMAALDARRVPLQSIIGREVKLRNTPQLRFLPDPAITEGQKVEDILSSIRPPLEES